MLWCSVYKTVGIQCYPLLKKIILPHQFYWGFFLYCNLVFFSANNVSMHFWSKFNHLFTARPSLLIRSFLSVCLSFSPRKNFLTLFCAELYCCFGRPTFKRLPYLFSARQTFFQYKQLIPFCFLCSIFAHSLFSSSKTVSGQKRTTNLKENPGSNLFIPAVCLQT